MSTEAPHNKHLLHPIWPAEAFYWARLPVPADTRPRPLHDPSWAYRFEEEVPVALEDLQLTLQLTPAGDSVIACAVEHAQLNDVLPDGALTLTPDSLPSWLECSLEPSAFNLLHGVHSPVAVTTVQRARRGWAILTLLICALLGGLGMFRRTDLAEAQIRHSQHEIEQLASALLPPAARSATLPPSLQMTARLRSLRQLEQRPDAASRSADGDVGAAFAALCRQWPPEVTLRLQTLSLTRSRMTLEAMAATLQDADALMTALASLPNWQLAAPEITPGPAGVAIRLQWTVTEDAP